mgnify:CR=1 FL=1
MNIMTYTGLFMDPLDPKPEQVRMEDIAHALSMICRANGHFPEIHTVAQHCLECVEEARTRKLPRQIQLFCLLHDGAEAYLGDFIQPVKARMEGYREAEDYLLEMIYRKFAGRTPTAAEEKIIKEIDKTLLYYEFLHYMNVGCGEPGEGLKSKPLFQEIPRKKVEEKYLAAYEELRGNLPG